MVAKETAWAWTLSNIEGREYRVLLVENYIIIGWGFLSNTSLQWTAYRLGDRAAAHEFAVKQTQIKEMDGFDMDMEPTCYTFSLTYDKDGFDHLIGKKTTSAFANIIWTEVSKHGFQPAA